MAIERVKLLRRPRNQVNNDTKFGRFLGLSSIEPVTSVGLVDDTTGAMDKALVNQKPATCTRIRSLGLRLRLLLCPAGLPIGPIMTSPEILRSSV